MSALRRIVLTALIAGVLAGLVSAAVQSVTTWPLIRAAERYEAPAAAAHDHAAQGGPGEVERVALTVLTTVLAGIGFGLMLAGAIALSGRAVEAREGVLWGAAGFAAFALAPALGLPPEPPGAAEADLAARQGWWLATALSTAAALWLVAFRRNPVAIAAAVGLILLPHVVGAPHAAGGGTVPAEIASRFAAASLVAAAAFWAVLGYATGAIAARFTPRA